MRRVTTAAGAAVAVARRLAPWCAVAITLALLIAAELRWAPSDAPTAPAHHIGAGQPFVEHDPGGASLVCISNRPGTILPPYLTAP